tara:strand:- start:76745 stop:78841 length:2097 start_codon:yes stop_codon:yes gene_type:complete
MSVRYAQQIELDAKLASSIVVKSSHLARHVSSNREILLEYKRAGKQFDPHNPYSWKYYLNLAGEYHLSDEPMTIRSIDTLDTIPFTKESLKVHRATYREYLGKPEYRAELEVRYPKNVDLIEGILNPVDIDIAINARENLILTHNKDLVEYNEVSLIEQLQHNIDTYFRNWENRDYAKIEDGYSLAQYYVAMTLLPIFIKKIRENNIRTFEVHSFYVWNYLESKAGLGRYRNYLTKQQALWLYRNIDHILQNLGKDSNVQLLVDNLLTPQGIPLGVYDTKLNVGQMTKGGDSEPFMSRRPLNFTDVVGSEPIARSLDRTLEKMIPLARDNHINFEQNAKQIETLLQLSSNSSHPTKLYESELVSSEIRDVYPLVDVLINHWAYLAYMGKYRSKFTFINPKTSNVMNMDALEAFLVWVYVTGRMLNVHINDIDDYTLFNLAPLSIIDRDVMKTKVSPNRVSAIQVDRLMDTLPIVKDYISPIDFKESCVEIFRAYKKGLVQINSIELYHGRGQLRSVFNRLYSRRTLEMSKLGYSTFQDLFNEKKWNLTELQKVDYERLSAEIMNKVLNLDLEEQNLSTSIQTALIEIFNRLTSLHCNVIKSASANNVIVTGGQIPQLGNIKSHYSSHVYVHMLREKIETKSQANSDWNNERKSPVDVIPISSVRKSTTRISARVRSKIGFYKRSPIHVNVSRVRNESR